MLGALTVFVLLMAVPGEAPGTFKFGFAMTSSEQACKAERVRIFEQHPDASLIIDCTAYPYRLPGRDA